MSDTAGKFEQGIAALSRDQRTRDVMKSFRGLHEAALADGGLARSVKELMALAVSITSQCDGCIAWHVQGALKAGATAEQVMETIGLAILMGGGPATYYGSKAQEELKAATEDQS